MVPCVHWRQPSRYGTRWITAETLKERGWVKGTHFLKTKDWTFKPDSDVLTSIRLKGPSYDFKEGFWTDCNFILHIRNHQSIFCWWRFQFFSETPKNWCIHSKVITSSTSKFSFGNTCLRTEPSEVDIAKQMLLVLAQSESFPVKNNVLQNKTVQNIFFFAVHRFRWSSPFRFRRLFAVECNVKQSIILDSGHLIVMMF